MKLICPKCKKNAKESYSYPGTFICKNKECSYFLKDDVRFYNQLNFSEDSNCLILGYTDKQEYQGFASLHLSLNLVKEIFKIKEDLTNDKFKNKIYSKRLQDREAFFYEYTEMTSEMNKILLYKKYENAKNLSLNNWKNNKQIDVLAKNLVITERGIRLQAKDSKNYKNIITEPLPWAFFNI